MGHYDGQCSKKKKKKGGTAATTEEAKFQTVFERECAFSYAALHLRRHPVSSI
jgi:hypothetical protein